MRLLFDENLSPRLPRRLASTYPDSNHVRDLGLRGQSDREIWDRARRDGYVLVTKDDDFRQLSFLHGAPPKVIWLVIGNGGTDLVTQLLQSRQELIQTFLADPEEAILILRPPSPH
jgi:predicted nuclease of predicted toxin-antitoxin system